MIVTYGKIRKYIMQACDVSSETDDDILMLFGENNIDSLNASVCVVSAIDYAAPGATGKILRSALDAKGVKTPVLLIAETDRLLKNKTPEGENVHIIIEKSKKPETLKALLEPYLGTKKIDIFSTVEKSLDDVLEQIPATDTEPVEEVTSEPLVIEPDVDSGVKQHRPSTHDLGALISGGRQKPEPLIDSSSIEATNLEITKVEPVIEPLVIETPETEPVIEPLVIETPGAEPVSEPLVVETPKVEPVIETPKVEPVIVRVDTTSVKEQLGSTIVEEPSYVMEESTMLFNYVLAALPDYKELRFNQPKDVLLHLKRKRGR